MLFKGKNTLMEASAAGSWCHRSRIGRLTTSASPRASWMIPSPVWPFTPTTRWRSSSFMREKQSPKFSQAYNSVVHEATITQENPSKTGSRSAGWSTPVQKALWTQAQKGIEVTSNVVVSSRTAPSSSLSPPSHWKLLNRLMWRMSSSR